ncbi:DUF4244 domain-containing protein [Micrococcales bacterium 31B]|nr:DUF4244 domain-containing protein [Micrococcales bacterium 31B]
MKNFRITPPSLVLSRIHTRAMVRMLTRERGASTVEYALITLAAAALAAVLMIVLTSGDMKGMITNVFHKAFKA